MSPTSQYADAPPEVVEGLRRVCRHLPEAYEEQAWAGTRWRVRKRTFVHALTADSARGSAIVMTFRSSGPELVALRQAGHPFFSPGWGTNVVGMVFGPDADWDEVAELVTDSYCLLAPKRLARLVQPDEG